MTSRRSTERAAGSRASVPVAGAASPGACAARRERRERGLVPRHVLRRPSAAPSRPRAVRGSPSQVQLDRRSPSCCRPTAASAPASPARPPAAPRPATRLDRATAPCLGAGAPAGDARPTGRRVAPAARRRSACCGGNRRRRHVAARDDRRRVGAAVRLRPRGPSAPASARSPRPGSCAGGAAAVARSATTPPDRSRGRRRDDPAVAAAGARRASRRSERADDRQRPCGRGRARERQRRRPVDPELTDQVVRAIDGRIVAHRERMGRASRPWPSRRRRSRTRCTRASAIRPCSSTPRSTRSTRTTTSPSRRSPGCLAARAVRQRQPAHARDGAVLRHLGHAAALAEGRTSATLTRQVVGLMEIDRHLHAPPVLQRHVGVAHARAACWRASSQKFMMFMPTGMPGPGPAHVHVQRVHRPRAARPRQINLQTADFTQGPRGRPRARR